jgi:hypothetical protein
MGTSDQSSPASKRLRSIEASGDRKTNTNSPSVARGEDVKPKPQYDTRVVLRPSSCSVRTPHKEEGNSKKLSSSNTNTRSNTESTLAEDQEMAIEVLRRLLEHVELERKVSELTGQVKTLLKQKSAADEKYVRLSAKYEQAFDDLLDSNDHLAERNKQINIEIGRNQNHLDTITTMATDLETNRKEIERLTKLTDAQHQDMEHQRLILLARPTPLPNKSIGLLVLEFYMYRPRSNRFKFCRTHRTNTTQVTGWLQLWRASEKEFTPDGADNDTIAQVQDVVFADTFVTISPKHFTIWLECLKVQAISERRCRCLWFPKHLGREKAHEAARNIF